MSIKELIGETNTYDKKEKLEISKPKNWLKSVSAFANEKGGKLIFGIRDNDEIIGLPDAKHDSEVISEAIKTKMDPIPDFDIFFETIDDKQLLIVDVKSGSMTPYYYKDNGMLIAYMRVGNESVPTDSKKQIELVLKGSKTTYDALRSKYDFNKMSFTKLKSVYKQRTNNDFEDSYFESFGLINENGDLTNAGALLADESPIRHSRLFCTLWQGLDKGKDAIDSKEYSGSLVSLLQEGIAFVIRNSKQPFKKLGDYRLEIPDYPERAVTEALVNALIHRDYTELGSEVHLDIFYNRLEVYSPGGMYSGIVLDENNLMNIPSRRRNPIIADVFGRLNYMERKGSGFRKMIESYEFHDNYTEDKKPVIKCINDDFFVTLFNMNYHEDQSGPQDGPQDGPQGEPQESLEELILNLIKDNNKISKDEMAERLGVGRTTITRKIKAIGNIKYVGSGYSGHWEIDD